MFLLKPDKMTHSVYVLRGYCLQSVGSGEEDADSGQRHVSAVCHKHFLFLTRLLKIQLGGR